METQTILEATVRWCSRPYMFLLTGRHLGRPDLSTLLLLQTGFKAGDNWQVSEGHWRQFEHWLAERHPELFREGHRWYGEGLVRGCGGDDAAAASQLRAYVEEYRALPEVARALSQGMAGLETRPRTLLEALAWWCSRPHEFLVTLSDHGRPVLDNIILLREGFVTGEAHPEHGEEWLGFMRWLERLHPEYWRDYPWYGAGLLHDCKGDHIQAARLMGTYLEQYLSLSGRSRGRL